MSSRFRGELTTVPPVQVAVRGRGIETTIGWNVNGADRALHGTGLRSIGDPGRSGALPTDRFLIPGTRIDFGGGSVNAMTSHGLGELKRLLTAAETREREIRADITKARLQHAVSWTGRALAWSTLASVVSRKIRVKANQAVALRKTEVSTLRENLASSRVSISFDMETAVADPHRRMLEAFGRLATCDGRWALQNSQMIDRVKARSMSSVVIARQAARLARRSDPLIDTADAPPALAVQNGRAVAYFYPGFVLVVDATRSDFALVDLKELDVRHQPVRFTENQRVPTDGQVVGKVWAKSNKNGTPDRRFKDNRELPVLLYGELSIEGQGGLREAFQFSRNETCEAFARAINDLKRLLAAGHRPPLPADSKPLLR